jgi:hypothetical protein
MRHDRLGIYQSARRDFGVVSVSKGDRVSESISKDSEDVSVPMFIKW